MSQAQAPRWSRDLERLLPIRSQYVVSGNIRDTFLTPLAGGPALVPLLRCLWETLRLQGTRCLLVFDPADGIRVYPNEPVPRELAERLFDLKLASGNQMISLETLTNLMKNLTAQREARCALVLDFASRLTRHPDHLAEGEHRFFVAAEKLSLATAPVVPKDGGGLPAFNPVLWLVNRAQDLPSWFTLDSERVASLIIAKPDYESRQAAAQLLAPLFGGFAAAVTVDRDKFVKNFTDGTDGMSLTALSDITELASRQGLGIAGIDDAVRCYKVGALDNPWRKDYLRARIRDAGPFIEERVKGQRPAVVKMLDILKRSVMGLTGAQARSGGSRPRGVLFFAGPTGVGKTELAKTLTQLVFGDERAYIRFDMSEFAEEHAGARLLGAPPGYIGFDAGGELTNAVREKPFSVVLFDEIEKAHPRILDKFLQILEDGRLTDGKGETVMFSDTVIVFTSNIGAAEVSYDSQDVRNEFIQKVRQHFVHELKRPELLGRIGEANIIPFNFMRDDGFLMDIARAKLEPLRKGLKDKWGVSDLRLIKEAEILALLVRDVDRGTGGRGVPNALTNNLIDPLADFLFEQMAFPDQIRGKAIEVHIAGGKLLFELE